MHLGVLYQEACSVLIPTGHYLEQRKRVRRVEEATHGLIDREGVELRADGAAHRATSGRRRSQELRRQ
jgi:hypothetical protein